MPKLATDPVGAGDGAAVPERSPAAISAASAQIFRIISTLCAVLPARTPKQLIAVSAAMAAAASALSLAGTGNSSRK